VSAADKLHNARATVGDLRADGAWADFNACYHQSLWYYSVISAIIGERLPSSRTAKALDQAVSELYDLTPDVERPAKVGPYVPACPSAPPCERAAVVVAGGDPITSEVKTQGERA
jgi:hypothetical protein